MQLPASALPKQSRYFQNARPERTKQSRVKRKKRHTRRSGAIETPDLRQPNEQAKQRSIKPRLQYYSSPRGEKKVLNALSSRERSFESQSVNGAPGQFIITNYHHSELLRTMIRQNGPIYRGATKDPNSSNHLRVQRRQQQPL